MMLTSASTHTGGGLWDVGAKMAGLTPVWGVEYRHDIAAVARKNIPGFCVIVSDVASVIYSALQRIYHLHSSPSCKNASGANSKGEEAIEDIESALAICAALRALEPVCFTLENVTQYRDFMSFRLILACLSELGYCVKYWVLNSADYGVPQTRKRLILVARKDREPIKPTATHYKPDAKKAVKGMRSMFWQPWNGWYASIKDLIPTLPESEFAPWQMERLPVELKSMLVGQGGYLFSNQISNDHSGNEYGIVRRPIEEPAFTITANHNMAGLRAYLVSSIDGTIRDDNEPSNTIVAVGDGHSVPPRALLISGAGNTNFAEAKPGKGCRYEDEPAQTVTTVTKDGGQLPKAFIVDGQNANSRDGIPTIRQAGEPIYTVTNKGASRAFALGRVVKMTPRCLARFQSVPDWYELPEPNSFLEWVGLEPSNGLVCEVIGNGVPCLLAKAICESLI